MTDEKQQPNDDESEKDWYYDHVVNKKSSALRTIGYRECPRDVRSIWTDLVCVDNPWVHSLNIGGDKSKSAAMEMVLSRFVSSVALMWNTMDVSSVLYQTIPLRATTLRKLNVYFGPRRSQNLLQGIGACHIEELSIRAARPSELTTILRTEFPVHSLRKLDIPCIGSGPARDVASFIEAFLEFLLQFKSGKLNHLNVAAPFHEKDAHSISEERLLLIHQAAQHALSNIVFFKLFLLTTPSSQKVIDSLLESIFVVEHETGTHVNSFPQLEASVLSIHSDRWFGHVCRESHKFPAFHRLRVVSMQFTSPKLVFPQLEFGDFMKCIVPSTMFPNLVAFIGNHYSYTCWTRLVVLNIPVSSDKVDSVCQLLKCNPLIQNLTLRRIPEADKLTKERAVDLMTCIDSLPLLSWLSLVMRKSTIADMATSTSTLGSKRLNQLTVNCRVNFHDDDDSSLVPFFQRFKSLDTIWLHNITVAADLVSTLLATGVYHLYLRRLIVATDAQTILRKTTQLRDLAWIQPRDGQGQVTEFQEEDPILTRIEKLEWPGNLEDAIVLRIDQNKHAHTVGRRYWRHISYSVAMSRLGTSICGTAAFSLVDNIDHYLDCHLPRGRAVDKIDLSSFSKTRYWHNSVS